MIVTATLRHRETGQQGRYTSEFPGTPRQAIWMWTEGNYSCDCNRSIFLLGRELDDTLPCNSGDPVIELLDLAADGKQIYSPSEEECGVPV